MYNDELKSFINKHFDLIDSYRFDELYENCDPYLIHHLTELLIDAKIDFLPYMSIIYTYMFTTTDITHLILPSSIKYLEEGAFQNYTLTSITLSENITTIPEFTFCDCSSLTSITIPDSVTSIGDYAFAYCTSLTSITIPSSVTSIGDLAFDSCYNLTIKTPKGSYMDRVAKSHNIKINYI